MQGKLACTHIYRRVSSAVAGILRRVEETCGWEEGRRLDEVSEIKLGRVFGGKNEIRRGEFTGQIRASCGLVRSCS